MLNTNELLGHDSKSKKIFSELFPPSIFPFFFLLILFLLPLFLLITFLLKMFSFNIRKIIVYYVWFIWLIVQYLNM